jgi:hypothetical protein
MIRLRQASLALHSYNVPDYKYQMATTWTMPKNARPSDIVYWILYARDHSPELELKNVVINSHGSPGYIHTGKNAAGQDTGIGIESIGVFKALRGKDIGTIWIVACSVASNNKWRSGKYFCSELAKASGCGVVAADATQHVDVSFYFRLCPYGCIDDYEGGVYYWDAAGGESRGAQNGSDLPGVGG